MGPIDLGTRVVETEVPGTAQPNRFCAPYAHSRTWGTAAGRSCGRRLIRVSCKCEAVPPGAARVTNHSDTVRDKDGVLAMAAAEALAADTQMVAPQPDDLRRASEAPSGVTTALPERWRPPVPGTAVGSYEVLRSLGRGSMGVVMKARDRHLDRLVAIKFIHPNLVNRSGMFPRFEEEARVMAKVRHEHVTAVHAFGEYDGAPYFVMEYVEGHDLEEMLRRRRGQPLVLDEALAILDAICRGVQAVHSAGAVHGDLKPANVLLGDANRVVVSDFGAARTIRDQHASGEAVHGTPAYLAPEYGLNHVGPVDDPKRADIYSLGVMAFELLAGRLPFPTDDVLEMLNLHANETPPTPSAVRADLPKEFDAVLLKALHKDPLLRHASVQRFRQELNQARRSVSDEHAQRRFVVADDEPVFRMLGQTILKAGFPHADIVCVEDGEAAFDAIVEQPTTVALVDLDMPGLDGLALVSKLRDHPEGQRVPVVVITGSGGRDDWKALAERGASGFLVKPVDPDSVLSLIRRLLHTDGA